MGLHQGEMNGVQLFFIYQLLLERRKMFSGYGSETEHKNQVFPQQQVKKIWIVEYPDFFKNKYFFLVHESKRTPRNKGSLAESIKTKTIRPVMM